MPRNRSTGVPPTNSLLRAMRERGPIVNEAASVPDDLPTSAQPILTADQINSSIGRLFWDRGRVPVEHLPGSQPVGECDAPDDAWCYLAVEQWSLLWQNIVAESRYYREPSRHPVSPAEAEANVGAVLAHVEDLWGAPLFPEIRAAFTPLVRAIYEAPWSAEGVFDRAQGRAGLLTDIFTHLYRRNDWARVTYRELADAVTFYLWSYDQHHMISTDLLWPWEPPFRGEPPAYGRPPPLQTPPPQPQAPARPVQRRVPDWAQQWLRDLENREDDYDPDDEDAERPEPASDLEIRIARLHCDHTKLPEGAVRRCPACDGRRKVMEENGERFVECGACCGTGAACCDLCSDNFAAYAARLRTQNDNHFTAFLCGECLESVNDTAESTEPLAV